MDIARNATNTTFNTKVSRQLAVHYPENTSDMAGNKLRQFNAKAHGWQLKAAHQIAKEPVKAAALGMAVGGLLAALALHRWRGGKA